VIRSVLVRRSARCSSCRRASSNWFLALAPPGRALGGGGDRSAGGMASGRRLPRACLLQLRRGDGARLRQLLQTGKQLHPGQPQAHGGPAQLAPRSRPSGAWSKAGGAFRLIEACWRPPNAAGPWPKAELSCWISCADLLPHFGSVPASRRPGGAVSPQPPTRW